MPVKNKRIKKKPIKRKPRDVEMYTYRILARDIDAMKQLAFIESALRNEQQKPVAIAQYEKPVPDKKPIAVVQYEKSIQEQEKQKSVPDKKQRTEKNPNMTEQNATLIAQKVIDNSSKKQKGDPLGNLKDNYKNSDAFKKAKKQEETAISPFSGLPVSIPSDRSLPTRAAKELMKAGYIVQKDSIGKNIWKK